MPQASPRERPPRPPRTAGWSCCAGCWPDPGSIRPASIARASVRRASIRPVPIRPVPIRPASNPFTPLSLIPPFTLVSLIPGPLTSTPS